MDNEDWAKWSEWCRKRESLMKAYASVLHIEDTLRGLAFFLSLLSTTPEDRRDERTAWAKGDVTKVKLASVMYANDLEDEPKVWDALCKAHREIVGTWYSGNAHVYCGWFPD